MHDALKAQLPRFDLHAAIVERDERIAVQDERIKQLTFFMRARDAVIDEQREQIKVLEGQAKSHAEAIEALRAWYGMQSSSNISTLYNAAARLFGSDFNPAEYDDVE